jgi:hypothetical protein
MRLTSTGLGIGTSSPSAKLDVAWGGFQTSGYALTLGADFGDSSSRTNNNDKLGAVAMPHYTNAEEQFGLIYGYSSSSENRIVIGGGLASQNSATNIRFVTGSTNTTTTGAERMRIDSAGNVGIGTSSPASRLHVSGSSPVLTLQGGAAGNANVAKFSITDSAGTEQFFFGTRSASNTDLDIGTQASSNIKFDTNATERMRIDSAGNVGIGTSSPDANARLSIGTSGSYTLAASGSATIATQSGGRKGYLVHISQDDDSRKQLLAFWFSVIATGGSVTVLGDNNANSAFDGSLTASGTTLVLTNNAAGTITYSVRLMAFI